MSALIPVRQNRPAILEHAGGVIYVSLHDAEYLRRKSEWKRLIAATHPDRGGGATTARRLLRQRHAWQQAEDAWYAMLGLTPPDKATVLSLSLRQTRKALKGIDTVAAVGPSALTTRRIGKRQPATEIRARALVKLQQRQQAGICRDNIAHRLDINPRTGRYFSHCAACRDRRARLDATARLRSA